MCFMLMLAAFRDQSKTPEGKYRLTGIETAVYARMALYASEDGTHIYPSINTLVAELKFSRTTIKSAIKSLLDKKRIFLVKEGNSITHSANEYKLNLDLMPQRLYVKPVTYVGNVDKYVNNIVDNVCITTPPMAPADPGAMASPDPGAMAPADPHNHLIKSFNKIINDREAINNIENDLIMMGVDKRSTARWLKEFGPDPLNKILKAMRDYEQQKGVEIKNKGAYLRKLLEQHRRTH